VEGGVGMAGDIPPDPGGAAPGSETNPFAAEYGGGAGSWHQTLLEEVARRAEHRAEELERRFRERMETSLSFELAKIERAKMHAVTSLSSGQLDSAVVAAGPQGESGQTFKRLSDLRQRYQWLQGSAKARWGPEELRARLSKFYERVCPSKLDNVTRIVSSFESRGGTLQDLQDLNNELLDAYGYDLDCIEMPEVENPSLLFSTASSTASGQPLVHHNAMRSTPFEAPPAPVHSAAAGRPALQDRLAMLSDEALVEARQESLQLSANQADEHLLLTCQSVDSSNAVRSHPNQTSAPHHPTGPCSFQQDFLQVSNSNRSAGSQMVLMPNSSFVGMPSPRWAGNTSAHARAKFRYTAKLPDELSLSVGDLIHITGNPMWPTLCWSLAHALPCT